jgi:predicted porin
MTRPLKSVALAAATLCLSAGAFAQSSASVYGLVDMSLGQFQNAGEEKKTKVQSGHMSTSYIGFKGSEELGGTIKAKFALESFLRADTGESGRFGGDTFWARAAWVGLQGDFGSTVLGRTTNQFFVSTLAFNAFGDSFDFSPSIRQVLTPSSVHPELLAFLGDTGWGNSILYSSPSSDGFSFNLQGSLGEGAATARGNSVGGNVLYFGSAFAATVAVQRVKHGVSGFTPAIQATGFESQDSAQVGVSYDLKAVKFYGQFSRVKTNATVDTQSTIYGIGASAPLGAGTLLAQYGNAKAEYPDSDVVNKTLTVGYDYSLSKSSDVYALVMHDKLTGVEAGNTVALGLRVKF